MTKRNMVGRAISKGKKSMYWVGVEKED